MRRALFLFLSVFMLFGMFGAGSAAVTAQGSDLADHPLVGSWLLDTDVEDPDNSVALVVFTADGIYIETDDDGTTGIGVWESTGDTTGQMTFRFVDPDGLAVIRASLEVSADGNTLTAEYTIEVIDPAGESTGEYGPGMAEGTRAEVEPMGEPAGTLEDLFSQFEGTPEATPAP